MTESTPATGIGVLAAERIPDDVVELARRRLQRELLRILQTGGGMSLDMLAEGPATDGGKTTVAAIHATVERIRQLRAQAPERAADLMAALLDDPASGVDLGAGLAPWSLALARRLPHTRFLAVDLPQEIDVLADAVSRAGLRERFDLAGLNMLRQEIAPPATFDVAIVANVAHLLTEVPLQQLLGRAADLLRPGGLLVVIDQVLDDDPDWVLWSALFAVGATLWLPGGTLYTESEYRSILTDTGLQWLGAWPLSPAPALTLLAARR